MLWQVFWWSDTNLSFKNLSVKGIYVKKAISFCHSEDWIEVVLRLGILNARKVFIGLMESD